MGWRKGGDGGGKKRPGDGGRGESARRPAHPEGHSSPAPRPGKASWRKKAEAAPAGSASGASPYYRRTGGFFGFLFGRRIKLWTLACLFTVLLGGIVWLLLSVPSRVPLVAVAVSAYRDPRIPQNMTALADIERFVQLESDTADFRMVGVASEKTATREFIEAFTRKLQEVKPGGSAFSRKSIIIYISAHGVVNHEGKACLLLAESDPLDDATWLPLADVLKAIRQEPRFRDATKLLALDCCRIRSDWRLGILDNRFAERVPGEIERAEIPNLAVLTSAGPGERAWAAPEFGGGTAFAHFLAAGLRGAAARHAGGRASGLSRFLPKETLSVGELCDFVSNRVNRWVSATRGARQKPRVIFGGSSGEAALRKADLAWISHHGKADSATDEAVRSRDESKSRELLAQLKQYWADHHRLQEMPAWGLFPMHWSEFELRLLRFEELYLEGVSETNVLDRARKEVDDALKPLNDPLPPIVFPGSQPLARNFAGIPAGKGPGTIEDCFAGMIDRYIDEPERAQLSKQIETAKTVRKQMEELAAPADPRVLYWLRPLLKPVDEQRRQAEDLLFVGNPQALGAADGVWKKLMGPEDDAASLAHVRAQSKAVAEALHRRDEVWARLWSLAQWLDVAEHRQVAWAAGLADQLDKLIADADTLTTKLEAIHAGEAPSLAETSAAAGQTLDHLLDEFNKLQKTTQRSREETAELEKTASFGIVSGLLRSPLLTGADRELLREKYDRIVGKLHESRHDLLKAQQAGEPEKKSDANASGDARRARQVVENMLAIPAPTDEDATSADERLTRTETAIRKALTGTFAKIRDAAANSEKAADADRAPTDLAVAGDEQWLKDDLARRAGLSAADLAGRRRAWFVPRLESPATRDDRTWQSPSRRLMQFDLAALALWQANRALDDFWGPVPGAPEKEPYFARAAREFLSGLDGDEAVRRDAYVADRRQALEAKLEVREKATRLAAKVDEKAVVFESQVAERKQTAAVTGSAGAPAGTAAVFVVRRGGRELERGLWYQDREHRGVWRQGVTLPADAAQKPAEFTILKEVTAGGREPQKLAARALFRGHLSSDADAVASFDAQMRFVRPIEPVAVSAPPPEIRLKGSRHAVTELMFIVDASGSMTENLAGKETKSIAEQKWTLAKSAMRTIMSELVARQTEWDANDEEWRAGLMVYGHRVVWLNRIGNPQYNVRATEEERQQWAANQVLPHTDVELLVDLKRFDADLGERINTALNRASPCGPTPLYYSLREAVKVFERVPPNPGEQPSRHIILVTDGVNNPMPPPGGVDVVPGALQAALRTFKQTHQNSAITVDVVYFGLVGEGERNAIPGLKNFVNEANDLAVSRPGEKTDHMHMAASPENLIYSVRTAVERSRLKYRVVRAGTPAAADGFQPANSTWTAPAQGALPDSFTVQIEGSPETFQEVRLEGGEALRLLFKKDKLEFEPQPAEKGLLKRLTAGSGRSRVNVHPFVPASGSDDVLFKYGVQFADGSRFTPRPSDFWAEVTPVHQDEDGTSRDGGHEPAVFFDRSFAPAQRMPVLQFKFPRWPAQANAGRVKLWIRFPDARGRSPVDPQRLKYRDVQKSSAAADGGYKLSDFPVALRVAEAGLGNGRVRITVVEQQLDDGRARDWCRIELSARADAVTRRYFLGERRADHVFEFQDGKKPDPGDLELLVTPAAVLKDNALQIPADEDEIRPVPVTPPSAGDRAPE